MAIRTVKRLVKAKPTLQGAGVHLHRAFGFGSTSDTDPFLLLDDFRNERPEDYLGSIGAGDIQWMTAGRGIIHQEMPKGDPDGRMHGFQLWANLPSSLKTTAPRYQDVKAGDVPRVVDDDGVEVRVVCGSYRGTAGPVDDVAARPVYLDVTVPAGKRKVLPVETTSNAFAYVFGGGGKFCNASAPLAVPSEAAGWADAKPPSHADNRSLVLFDRGDEVELHAGDDGIRFLLISGQPFGEPVAWYGPVVMNSQEELRHAFQQLEDGTFLRADARR